MLFGVAQFANAAMHRMSGHHATSKFGGAQGRPLIGDLIRWSAAIALQ